MLILLCKLWPYLAGGLVGWLFSGWFARHLKYGPAPVEKIVEKEVTVEKRVDNPEHLTRIKALEQENSKSSGYLSRIKTLEAENSKFSGDRFRIGDLESEITNWKSGPKIDIAAAKAAGIAIKAEDDFTAIEGIGPKINDLIHADGIHTFYELSQVEPSRLQKILDSAGANFQMADPGTWPDQATLACNNRWPALKALQDILDGGVYPDIGALTGGEAKTADNSQHLARISDLEGQLEALRRGPVIDTEIAKAVGFAFKAKDNRDHVDFTVVEGIGPKIDELIHAAGIHTYQALAKTNPAAIQKILDDAGPNFKLAKPATWPAQSGLAASNQWEALMAWQDILDGGEE